MRIIGERNVDDAVTSSRGYRGSIFNLINDSQKGLSGFPNRANIKASLNTLDEKKKISSIYKAKRDQEEDTKRNFKIGMDMTRNPNKHFLIEITGKNLTFLTKYMDTFKRNINDFNVIFVYVATGSINRFNMCKKRDDKEITKGVETYIDSVFNNKSFTPAPRVINYSGAVDCITEDKNVIENLKILRNICLKRDKPVADENRIYLDSERGKPEEKCGDKIFNDSNQFKLLIFRNNLEYSHEYMSNNESYELVYHHDYDKYLYTADFDRIIDKAYSDEILLHHIFGDDITSETAKSFIYTNVKFNFPKRVMDYYIPMTDYEYIIPVTTKKINPIYQNDTIDDIKTKPYRDRPIIKNPYAMSRLPKRDVYFPPTNPISVYYYNTIDFSASSPYEKTFIETMTDSLRSFRSPPVKYQFSISKSNPLRSMRSSELVSTPSRESSSSSSSSSSSRPVSSSSSLSPAQQLANSVREAERLASSSSSSRPVSSSSSSRPVSSSKPSSSSYNQFEALTRHGQSNFPPSPRKKQGQPKSSSSQRVPTGGSYYPNRTLIQNPSVEKPLPQLSTSTLLSPTSRILSSTQGTSNQALVNRLQTEEDQRSTTYSR